jgi:hypothetical protein
LKGSLLKKILANQILMEKEEEERKEREVHTERVLLTEEAALEQVPNRPNPLVSGLMANVRKSLSLRV